MAVSRGDPLLRKIDDRFAQIDRRFDQVDEHFGELRQSVDFGLDRLRAEMQSGFQEMQGRFQEMQGGFQEIQGGFRGMTERFNRLERKLDQFIDVQLRVNQDHDARLRALEGGRRSRKS